MTMTMMTTMTVSMGTAIVTVIGGATATWAAIVVGGGVGVWVPVGRHILACTGVWRTRVMIMAMMMMTARV